MTIFISGCGSGGSDAEDSFVFTGGTLPPASRAVTFNFVKAQAPLEVPSGTVRIRFDFLSESGALVQQEVRDFASTITIDPVNASSRTVVITALSEEGFPLLNVVVELSTVDEEVNFSGLIVNPISPQTLTITPAISALEVGESAQLQAVVLFSNGETVVPSGTDVMWSADHQATIDANGLITGNANGASTVTATVGSVTDSLEVTIGSGLELARLQVSPENASVGLDLTIPYSVLGFDQNDNAFPLDSLDLVWSATGNAVIDPDTGLATGNSLVPDTLEGAATITATVGTISDSTGLTILGQPGNILSIVTTPNPLEIDLDNATGNLSTMGDFQNGPDQILTNADNGLLYSITGNPGVASVDMTTGEVTAIAQGTTQVRATAAGKTDTVTVEVDFGAAGNVAPEIVLDGARLNLLSDSVAVQIFPSATVSDPTQAAFVSGTLTVEALNSGNRDVSITLPTNPDIGTVTNNGSNSVSVALTSSATPANVQTVLRAATISALMGSTGTTGQIQVTVDDGLGLDGSATRDFGVPVVDLVLSGNHTFDTDTGFLDGVASPNFNGTRLSFLSFELQSGAFLNITGSKAFQLETAGDIVIDGVIGAAGKNGELGEDGGAGGLAGPGGFPGGRGGDIDDPNGADGAGPGGGKGALVSESERQGGGAGHLNAGTDGARGALGGVAYLSIPTSLIGGSGGGGGISTGSSVSQGGGGGGGGGGAVRMTALGRLIVGASATIDCSGGDSGFRLWPGGGGSGGAIELLASLMPIINGVLDVTGGSGGMEVGGSSPDGSGNGSDGRTLVDTI